MTLKIQQVSDLHLEFDRDEPYTIPTTDADVLILAGDIINARGIAFYEPWFLELTNRYNDIIYIPGNHEFYGGSWTSVNSNLEDLINRVNLQSTRGIVHFLHNKHVKIKDVNFIGATLWTSFNEGDPDILFAAPHMLNDYRTCYGITAGLVYQDHQYSRAFIEASLKATEGKKVVVTHHAPHPNSIHPKYKDDVTVNYLYHSNLTDLLEQADLWFHGHTHTNFDYNVKECRVICNPRGYARYEENYNYKPTQIIEI